MNRSIRILIVACMAAAAHQAPVMAMQEMVKKDFDSHCAAALNPNQPVRERRIQIQRARQLLGTIGDCEQLFAAILDSKDMNELSRLNAASDAELGAWERQIRDIISHFRHDTNLNDRLNAAKTAQRMLADYRAIGHGVACSSLENEINRFIFVNSRTGSQDDFDVAGDSPACTPRTSTPVTEMVSAAAGVSASVSASEPRPERPVPEVVPVALATTEEGTVASTNPAVVTTDRGVAGVSSPAAGPEAEMSQRVLNTATREAGNTLRGADALLRAIVPTSAGEADRIDLDDMSEFGDQSAGGVRMVHSVSEPELSIAHRALNAVGDQMGHVGRGASTVIDTLRLTRQAGNILAGLQCVGSAIYRSDGQAGPENSAPAASVQLVAPSSAHEGVPAGVEIPGAVVPVVSTGSSVAHAREVLSDAGNVATSAALQGAGSDVEAGRRPTQPEGTVAQETILSRVGRELINTWQGVQRVGSMINPFGGQTGAVDTAGSGSENSASAASEEKQSVVAQSSAPEAGSARLEPTSAVVPAATPQDGSPRADTQVGAEGGYEGSRYETASQPPSGAVIVNMPGSAQDDPESGMAAAGAPVESSNLFLRTFHLVGNWVGRARTVADNAMNWLASNFGLGDLDNGKEE